METIETLQKKLQSREISAVELVQQYSSIIEKAEPEINALLTRIPAEDLEERARLIDEKIAREEPLPALAGIPYTLKDAILAKGVRCTAASRMLDSYISSYDATVERRLKEAGAILLGKTNMDEFGMGASTENSAFGVVRNPHDKSRVAGGSSGGSAASVAAREAIFSLGEDTGGSIRLPASFCGVVGLKPTYGAVSRSGLIAFGSSLDQIGPIAKTAEDAKIIFKSILGKDKLDATSREYIFSDLDTDMKDLKIGIPKEYFVKGIDPEVEKIIKETIKKVENHGAKIEEVSLPNTEFALACYYIIAPAEASANLARFDGVK